MNHTPNEPKNPDPINAAWEDAMTRDFDARVRDLHEAPLDIGSVKGKAHQIKRNRRAAVAGGVLGVAAVITPIAVIVGGHGDAKTDRPPVVGDPSETISDPAASNPEYIADGVWHQADGDLVRLDRGYDAAVLWGSQLVATYFDGEAFSVADVIDEAGDVVDSFDTTGPVVVNDEGTTIAWIDTDGTVMTAWDGDRISVGTVDLAAAGEGVAFTATAVAGGPSCDRADGGDCVVYVKSGLGGDIQVFGSDRTTDIVAPGITEVFDATSDGVISVRTQTEADLDTCGGLFNTVDGTVQWETCDYQVHQISPDGQYVVAPPSQYDGLGPFWISVLDTATRKETGRSTAEGGFIGTWAWTSDGQLIFDSYDGARWHLFTMAPESGVRTEIGDPVKGNEFSPFTLVQR